MVVGGVWPAAQDPYSGRLFHDGPVDLVEEPHREQSALFGTHPGQLVPEEEKEWKIKSLSGEHGVNLLQG